MAFTIQPTSDVLVPGEAVRVPIVLRLTDAIKARGIHATFHGAEETKATYTTYNAATKTTQTHTAVEHVDIVKREYLLSGREREGFFGNLADGFATLFGGGDHDLLEPGEHSFEIEVQLPADARGSMSGEKCRVFYELSVQVDVPAGRDLKAVYSFRVPDRAAIDTRPVGPVRTVYPDDQKRGLLDAWFGPDICVEAAVAEGNLAVGDTIEGIFEVRTPKPLDYRGIYVQLISVEQSQAQGHTAGHTHLGERIRLPARGVMDGNYTQKFSLPVVAPGPMTSRGQRFSIDCYLQISLDVPWAKDPAIRVPVTLRPSAAQPS